MPRLLDKKEPRNLGIELFRIVSMLLIVCLHVLGRGGVYPHTVPQSANYYVAWYLETIAVCSVNCYALISGYANIKSGFKFRRILYLWLEVLFITVSTTAIFAAFGGVEITKDQWLTAFFPLINREYWYFNAYMILFFFIPVMNKGIAALTQKQHLIILCCLFALTTLGTFIGNRDIFNLGGGYTAIWLLVLYIFGAYFRLHGIPKFANPGVCLLIFFGSCTAAWGQKMLIESSVANGLIAADAPLAGRAGALISYVSPFTVLMALSLLCLFGQVKIRTRLGAFLVKNLAKASFGVFLVHVGTMVWGVMYNHWVDYAALNVWAMTGAVLGTVLAVYLICSAYSILRIQLFKLLHIHQMIDLVCDLPAKLRAKKQPTAALSERRRRVTLTLGSLGICVALAVVTILIPFLWQASSNASPNGTSNGTPNGTINGAIDGTETDRGSSMFADSESSSPPEEPPASADIVDKQCTLLKDTGADTYYRVDLTYADGSQLTFIDPVTNLPDDQKEEHLAHQIQTVNELANANLDVNFYVFVPTSFEFSPILSEYIPETSNYPYIGRFLDGLDPRIKSDSMVFYTLEERLYINYRSDLHWCDDGIYMGYCKLYDMMYEDAASPLPPKYTVAERITLHECKFYGRHSRKMGVTDVYDIFTVNDYRLPTHTTVPSITFKERVEKIRVSDDHTRNIYGEYFPQLDKVSYPENQTGRNLMIIGDSFTQSIVELLGSAFDNTYAFYISDYRGLSYNEFIEENNITDVLVMQDAYRLVLDSDSDSNLDKILDK